MRVRPVAIDESEFFSATLKVRHGLVPHRDFWEHHVPLQWVVMAPLIRVSEPPSVDDLMRMRRLQSLLWIPGAAAFAGILVLRGASLRSALSLLALLSSCVLFSAFAVEYRIDTPTNVLFLVGLLLAERGLDLEGRAALVAAAGAGAVLALSALSSQRMGPVAALALVLYAFVRRDGRWGPRPAFLCAWGGTPPTTAAVLVVFAALGGLPAFLDQNVAQNAAYERMAARDGVPRVLPIWPLAVAVEARDGATLVLVLIALGTLVSAGRTLREPGPVTRFGLLAGGSAAVLGAIRSPYPYQAGPLLIVLALLAGLGLARTLDRPRLSAAAPALSIVAAACSLVALLGIDAGPLEATARFQEHVLATVTSVTGPEESVLDGCALPWNRPGASPHWFMPPLVTSLTRAGLLAPFGSRSLAESRPGAVVWDHRLELYASAVPEVGTFLVRNYLPLERVVWVPAPNGRLAPGESKSWTVLRSGTYRVAAHPALSSHPWFDRPLVFPQIAADRVDRYALNLWRVPAASTLSVKVEGVALGASAALRLIAGQRLEAANLGREALGVCVWPGQEGVFFRDPFPSVPLWPLPDIR